MKIIADELGTSETLRLLMRSGKHIEMLPSQVQMHIDFRNSNPCKPCVMVEWRETHGIVTRK